MKIFLNIFKSVAKQFSNPEMLCHHILLSVLSFNCKVDKKETVAKTVTEINLN
jgi:hypothetical protein